MMSDEKARSSKRVSIALCAALATLASGCSEDSEAATAASRAAAAPAPPAPVTIEPISVEVAPKIPATGKVVTFDLYIPEGHPAVREVRATFGGRKAAVAKWDEEGRHFKGLTSVDIEDTRRALDLIIEATFVDDSPLQLKRRIDVADGVYDERKLKVSKRFTKPPKRVRRRIKREKADIKRILGKPDAERHWQGSFRIPLNTEVTSVFGTLRTYNKRKKPSRHLGLDLDGKTGDPIHATARGRVALVQDRYYSGRTVVLDHGQGLFSLYFHMSKFEVKEGSMVERGQLIGRVGKTGRVTGPHLHFGVKLDGLYFDPATFLELKLDDDPLLAAKAKATSKAPGAVEGG